jgi:hypothetical protein
MPPSTQLINKVKPMSARTQKTLLAALGAVLIALPGVVPALAPFAPVFMVAGGALGGGAFIRSPGDVRGSK